MRGGESSPLTLCQGVLYYTEMYCTVLRCTALYCTVARRARTLIERHNSSQPLFLYVAYQAAHGPIVRPPDKYLDMYSAQVKPKPHSRIFVIMTHCNDFCD